jgi:hypothetical protein
MHSIELRTIQHLIDRDHTLALYCTRCDRWALAPLRMLAARGHADTPFARLRFRCVRCGAPGHRQLRPPALRNSTAVGWVQLEHPGDGAQRQFGGKVSDATLVYSR